MVWWHSKQGRSHETLTKYLPVKQTQNSLDLFPNIQITNPKRSKAKSRHPTRQHGNEYWDSLFGKGTKHTNITSFEFQTLLMVGQWHKIARASPLVEIPACPGEPQDLESIGATAHPLHRDISVYTLGSVCSVAIWLCSLWGSVSVRTALKKAYVIVISNLCTW